MSSARSDNEIKSFPSLKTNGSPDLVNKIVLYTSDADTRKCDYIRCGLEKSLVKFVPIWYFGRVYRYTTSMLPKQTLSTWFKTTIVRKYLSSDSRGFNSRHKNNFDNCYFVVYSKGFKRLKLSIL